MATTGLDWDDADTIELELTPEQVRVLMQAAAASSTTPVPSALSAPPALSIVAPRVKQDAGVKRRVGVRLAVAAGIAGAAVMLSGVAYVVGKRSVPVQVVVETSAPPPTSVRVVPDTPPPPPAQPEPVRFTNPFDASEVFEFPPGTSPEEARDAVAELLLQRARERQNNSPAPVLVQHR